MSGGKIDNYKLSQGFTLIETMIVVIVVAILATLVIISARAYLERAHDSERATDISTIAHELERYYQNNPTLSGSTYPPVTTTINEMAKIISDPEAIRAPGASSISLVMATTNLPQTPLLNVYTYQPLAADNSLCSETICTHFKLYYHNEISNQTRVVNSMRQQ